MANNFDRPSASKPSSERPCRLSPAVMLSILTGFGIPEGCATLQQGPQTMERPSEHENGASPSHNSNASVHDRREHPLREITLEQLRHEFYGSFDPRSPSRPQIPTAAASGEMLIQVGSIPSGVLAPLPPMQPGDRPTSYNHEISSTTAQYDQRLHEGGRTFEDVLRHASSLHFSYRLGQMFSSSQDGSGGSEEFFANWRTLTLDPTIASQQEANQHFRQVHFQTEVHDSANIESDVYHACFMAIIRNIFGGHYVHGRLQGAENEMEVSGSEQQGTMRNIRLNLERQPSGELSVTLDAEVAYSH